MAKEFTYKVVAEADVGNLEREVAKINTALANARGSVNAFKEEIEKNSKGETEYKIVIRSEFDASGSKVAKASVQEVSKEYEGLLNAIRRIEKEPQKGSLTSLRQQVAEAKQARDAMAKYSSSIDGIGNRIQSLDGRWSAQNQKVKNLQRELDIAGASNLWQRLSAEYSLKGFEKAGKQISDFVNIFQSISIIAGQVVSSINNVVNALGNLQSFRLAFEAVGAGAGSANLALSESSRIASGLGVDLKTTRESFQQLSPVILNSGGSISDVSGVVETLSSRFAAYGISGDRAKRVTNGVIQAFAKGKLMAEELTQQISEADPAFKTDLAGAMKVTVAGLEQLVKSGEVTSDVFLKALLKIGKSELLFGRLGTSAADAANSLRTSGTTVDQVRAKFATIGQLSLERFAKSIEPLIFSFLQLGAVVTDAFDRISRLQGIDSIGNIAGGIAQAFIRITEAVLRFTEAGLAVIGIIAKVANVLTSIPGVTDAIAIAIASKLIAPLVGLKATFGSSISAATAWGRAIRTVATFPGLGESLKGVGNAISGMGRQSKSTGVQILELADRQEALGQKALRVRAIIASLESKVLGYQRVIAGQKALPSFGGDPRALAQVERYGEKIERNERRIGQLRNALLGLNADQYEVSRGMQNLADKKSLAGKASGALSTALRGAGRAGTSLLGAMGPLGVALAAIAVVTSAYQNANQSSNSILEQSKARVEALNQALEELGGKASKQEEPITGLALAWAKFSFLISDIGDSLGRVFSGFGPDTQKATKGILGVLGSVVNLTTALALGAVAGAALFSWTGIGAIPAALIGAVTAGVIALSSSSGDAAVKQRQLIKDTNAAKNAIIEQANAAGNLISGLEPLDKASVGIDLAPSLAGFRQAETALALLKKDVKALSNEKIRLKADAAELKKPSAILVASFNKVEAQFAKLQGLKDKIASEGGWDKASKGLRAMAVQAKVVYNIMLKNFREEFGADAADKYRQYLELQSGIKIVNDRLYEAQAAYDGAIKKLDDYARASGLLTSEQKEVVDTSGKLEEKLKLLQSTLQYDLNPRVTPGKWQQVSAEIADTTARINALKDAATSSINNELVYTIKTRINKGEIENSLSNAQRILQTLEERVTVLDINSPALYGVLQDLEQAKVSTDQLNGKIATIRVEILEANGAGSTAASLNEIGRYIEALEQKKVTLSIGSPDISKVIEEQNRARALQDAGAQSSAQLKRFLRAEALNEELREIQTAQRKQSEASAERQRAISQELSRVKEVSEARLEGLRAATPAELELAQIQKARLQEQARSGNTKEDRVAAQAQLERLEREKQIAEEQKRAKEEQKILEAAAKTEAETARGEEKAFREATIAIQEELLQLQRQEAEEKIKAAQEVLKAREKEEKAASEAATTAAAAATAAETQQQALLKAAGFAGETGASLAKAAEQANIMARTLMDLNGKEIVIKIKTTGAPGRWAGGPATGGATYRINELGREGFLSNSGRLTPINKPRNALWKAPTSGIVIPAHIMKAIDVPSVGTNISSSKINRITGSMRSGVDNNQNFSRLANTIKASLPPPNDSDRAMHELSLVQAHQAQQIGKLSRAVNKLVDKDWSVNVGIRSNDNMGYFQALNRMM